MRIQRLAWALGKLAQHEDAERLSRGVLATRRQKLGEDDPATLEAMSVLGQRLLDGDKREEGEQLVRASYTGMRCVLGGEHPRTLEDGRLAGSRSCADKKFDEAEALLRHNWEGSQRSLGIDHPATLNAAGNLAWLLAYRNQPLRAVEILRENLEAIRRVRRRGSPGGGRHRKPAGQPPPAGWRTRGSGTRRARVGSGNRKAARHRSLRNGLCRESRGGVAECPAAPSSEASSYVQVHFGSLLSSHDADQSTASLFRYLADMCSSEGDAQQAEAHARMSLEAVQAAERFESPCSLAATLSTLAAALVAQNRAEEAEPLLRRCLEIRQQAQSPPTTGSSRRLEVSSGSAWLACGNTRTPGS